MKNLIYCISNNFDILYVVHILYGTLIQAFFTPLSQSCSLNQITTLKIQVGIVNSHYLIIFDNEPAPGWRKMFLNAF